MISAPTWGWSFETVMPVCAGCTDAARAMVDSSVVSSMARFVAILGTAPVMDNPACRSSAGVGSDPDLQSRDQPPGPAVPGLGAGNRFRLRRTGIRLVCLLPPLISA